LIDISQPFIHESVMSDSNGTCLVFRHKRRFHRKDAKDAKWFIYFVNKFRFVSRIHGPVQAQATFQAHDIKPFPVFLET